MTTDRLLLEDVRFYGHHGVSKAEQTVGVWFSVDAELAVDLAPAAVSDDLAAAIDYGEFPARQVRVRVRKLTPPLQGLVGTPSVELVRTR